MRNYSKTVGALAAASTLVAGYASAEIEGEVHVGYHNIYEFRFVDLGDDLIESGVDLSLGEWAGFSVAVGAWYASFDTYTSDFDGDGNNTIPPVLPGDPPLGTIDPVSGIQADELDLYGSIGYEIAGVSLELGYIYYYFPDGGGNTQEIYFGASYEFAFGLGIGATYYYDFDEFSGSYLDTSISYSIPFNDCLSLDLAAGVAFANGQELQLKNSTYGGGTDDGYQGYYVSAALPWEFRDGVTLTPYVKYTDGSSKLATDLYGVKGGQDYVVAGVSLAVGF